MPDLPTRGSFCDYRIALAFFHDMEVDDTAVAIGGHEIRRLAIPRDVLEGFIKPTGSATPSNIPEMGRLRSVSSA